MQEVKIVILIQPFSVSVLYIYRKPPSFWKKTYLIINVKDSFLYFLIDFLCSVNKCLKEKNHDV